MLKTNLGPTTPTAPARQTALTAERSIRPSDDATEAATAVRKKPRNRKSTQANGHEASPTPAIAEIKRARRRGGPTGELLTSALRTHRGVYPELGVSSERREFPGSWVAAKRPKPL